MNFFARATAWLIGLLIIANLCGCMTRRKRMMTERSELLREREQLLDPWQAKPLSMARDERDNRRHDDDEEETEEEPKTNADRVKQLDESISEIDSELLQLNKKRRK